MERRWSGARAERERSGVGGWSGVVSAMGSVSVLAESGQWEAEAAGSWSEANRKRSKAVESGRKRHFKRF